MSAAASPTSTSLLWIHQEQCPSLNFPKPLKASSFTTPKALMLVKSRNTAETVAAGRYPRPISSAAKSIGTEAAKIHSVRKLKQKFTGSPSERCDGFHVVDPFGRSNRSSNHIHKRMASKLDCRTCEHSQSDESLQESMGLDTAEPEAATMLSQGTGSYQNDQKDGNEHLAAERTCGSATGSENIRSTCQVSHKLQNSGDLLTNADCKSMHEQTQNAQLEASRNHKQEKTGISPSGMASCDKLGIEKESSSTFVGKDIGGFEFQQKKRIAKQSSGRLTGKKTGVSDLQEKRRGSKATIFYKQNPTGSKKAIIYDSDCPLVVEDEDPDWPDEGEKGWGFKVDQFFGDVKIKSEKGDDDDSDDESDMGLEEEDEDEWMVKGITSVEWEEVVFDPQPLVVLMYTRYGDGWSTNWSMLQELEKSVKFLWETRNFALRAAKMDGKMDKDVASLLKVKEFPTLLFIKGGKLQHLALGFKKSEEILEYIAHFFYGGPRPKSLHGKS